MSGTKLEDVCIEWAPFELRVGVTESDLLEAAEDLQNRFLDAQPGFVRRELLRGAERRWVDLIVWASRADADRAAARARESSACRNYFGLMADVRGGVQYSSRAEHYGPASLIAADGLVGSDGPMMSDAGIVLAG